MAELPLDEAVERFHGNEERINKFVNAPGGEESFETSGGEVVPVLPKMIEVVTAQADRATTQAQQAIDARDNTVLEALIAEDVADGLSKTDPDGLNDLPRHFRIFSSDAVESFIYYRHDSGGVATEITRLSNAAAVRALQNNMVETAPGKNLLDRAKIRRGFYFSPGLKSVAASVNYRCSGFIPVTAGETYKVSGVDTGAVKGFFSAEEDGAYIDGSVHYGLSPFVAPAGANYVVLNITSNGQDDIAFDDTAQVELGAEASSYEPYKRMIPASSIRGLPELPEPPDLSGVVMSENLFEASSFNLLNPAAVEFDRRYSTGNLQFVADQLLIAASGFIPVAEGEFYAVSGTAIYGGPGNMQGGYFASVEANTALQNIVFSEPVAGEGRIFQVPIGLGITHVVLNLKKTAGGLLDGVAQVEHGEMATPYEPYSADLKIISSLLPESSGGGGASSDFDSAQWYRFTEADDGHYLSGAFPVFRRHWILKDKDLCIAATGTSLFARSNEHCTLRADAAHRPPLLHSNNCASILWDRVKWEGQEYRRYDSGHFTESGAFLTATALPEWDDGIYRAGFTRYSESSAASISFAVPVDAWQFNLIYRTDSVGVEDNLVSVAEGAGHIEAFDENSSAWVEAHGYSFSMRESPVVTRSVMVPDPGTGVFSSQVTSSKGNTTYQRRLKMRCKSGSMDSRAAAKSVTIAAQSAGRFMYWGVEWSVREYMLTFINAARGSHNTRSLVKFQDNEVWEFKPDLMFFELAIHNDGAAAAGTSAQGFWAGLTNNYVFNPEYELSMKSRSAHFGLNPEIGMFTSSIAWNFGGINDDGSLKFGPEYGTGKMMTALDKFTEACLFVWDNHPDAVCINAAKRWVDAGVAIFGDLRTATEGSGKDGLTFTNESSHWNDTGSKIIAKALVPLFDFTHP